VMKISLRKFYFVLIIFIHVVCCADSGRLAKEYLSDKKNPNKWMLSETRLSVVRSNILNEINCSKFFWICWDFSGNGLREGRRIDYRLGYGT